MQKLDGFDHRDSYFPDSNKKIEQDPVIGQINEKIKEIFSNYGLQTPYPSLQSILKDQVLTAQRFTELVEEMVEVEKKHELEDGFDSLKSSVFFAIPNNELNEKPFINKLHQFVLSALTCVNNNSDPNLSIKQLRKSEILP